MHALLPLAESACAAGELFEPSSVTPARFPPTDWAELVQAHDDRDVFQASPDKLPVIDIHNALSAAGRKAPKPRDRRPA